MRSRSEMDPAELNPATVDAEIVRLSGLLDKATSETAKRARDAAVKRVAMKVALARAFVEARHMTEPGKRPPSADACEAHARIACEEQMLASEVADALVEGAREAGRNLREQIGSMRTLSANLRSVIG